MRKIPNLAPGQTDGVAGLSEAYQGRGQDRLFDGPAQIEAAAGLEISTLA